MTTMLPAFAGCNTIYGGGMLELGMTFSQEQFIIDNDIIKMTRSAMRGIPVSDETLGVASIQKVGIGNNFLAHKETRNNLHLVSAPDLFDRDMFGDWEAAGSKEIATVAHEKYVDIMKNHEVKAIDADLLADMQKVVDKADADFRAAL